MPIHQFQPADNDFQISTGRENDVTEGEKETKTSRIREELIALTARDVLAKLVRHPLASNHRKAA